MSSNLAIPLACLAALTAAAEPAPSLVLIGGYQALGVDAKQLAELEKSLRAAVSALPVKPIAADEAEKMKKGLAACGEDAACLAASGERVGARWVLGHGVAKVGAALLVNLLWVDVQKGKTVATASKRVTPAELASAGGALVAGLVKDLELVPPAEPPPPPPPPPTPPPAVLTPVAESAPPPPPEVVAPKGHALRNAAIGTGVVTGAGAIAAVVLGVLARSNYQALAATQVDMRAEGARRQGTLNLGADLALGVGVAAAATTVVLIVINQAGK